jgi:hypothetical protein
VTSKAQERVNRLFKWKQDGVKALSEHEDKEQATRLLTAKLRAERLARDAGPPVKAGGTWGLPLVYGGPAFTASSNKLRINKHPERACGLGRENTAPLTPPTYRCVVASGGSGVQPPGPLRTKTR